MGDPLNQFDMFNETVGLCWLWALATSLILRLAGKFRIERPLLLRDQVRARRVAEQLVLEVRDNGPGFAADWSPTFREGLGLKNTRERLMRLYKGEHCFELRKALAQRRTLQADCAGAAPPRAGTAAASCRDRIEEGDRPAVCPFRFFPRQTLLQM